MAHTYAQGERSPSIFASFRAAITGLSETLERRRVFGRTYDELASLSDRELDDIGVDRSDIAGIAWATAERV